MSDETELERLRGVVEAQQDEIAALVESLDRAATRANDALTERNAALRVVRDVEALVNAADEADLRPAHPDYQPIEVPWTVAVRACLGVPVDSKAKETPK